MVEEGGGLNAPGMAGAMGGLFLGRRIVDRTQRIFDLQKRPKWKYPKRN